MNRPRVMAFYGYSFFTHLLPLYAVYTVIINDEFQSPLVLSTLLAVWSLTIVVLEVPSGALADYWNRKHVAMVGQAAKVVTCLIWFLFRSYPAYLVGFIFWGIQESFCSGSVDALLYEETRRYGGESVFERHYSWCYRLSTIAITAAIFAGAYLYRVGPVWVFIVSMISSVTGLAFTMFFPVQAPAPGERTRHSYAGIIRAALGQAGGSAVIRRLFIYSVGYITVIGVVEEYIPVFLQSLEQSAVLFGLSLTLIMAAQTIGGFVSQRLELRTERSQYLFAMTACLALGLVHGSGGGGLSIPLLFLVFMVVGVLEIKLSSSLNEAIRGERATVLSLQSLVVNAGAILLSLGIGGVAEVAGLSSSFLVFAGVAALVLWFLYRAAGSQAAGGPCGGDRAAGGWGAGKSTG